MKRLKLAAIMTAILCVGTVRTVSAADPKDIIDKAIQAIDSEKTLSEKSIISWKAKGKLIFNGMESDFNTSTITQGIDHQSAKFEGDFGGNKIEGVTVIAGDKGWRSFNGMKMPLDDSGLASEKRNLYLQVVPSLLVPLTGEGFKLSDAGEKEIGGKPAVGIKVVGPDDKDFTLYFDKQSNLPVMQVATVLGFMGEEYSQETTFADYKDFDNIKKATKIEVKRDGTTLLKQEITEFSVVDAVAAGTFDEPK